MNSIKIIRQFADAINRHKTSEMAKCLDADFILVDSEGSELQGLDNNIDSWEILFSWFPDYRVEINTAFGDEQFVLAEGSVMGKYKKSVYPKDAFLLPLAWRVELSYNKITRLQVYGDTGLIREISNRHREVASDPNVISGLGGVFFKAVDPKKLTSWYDKHLGTSFGNEMYCSFRWRDPQKPESFCTTVFSIFANDSDYYHPSTKPFMFNFRVNDLEKMLQNLSKSGVTQVGKMESFDYGKFAWITDPEGNKIELWEPVDQVLDDYETSKNK